MPIGDTPNPRRFTPYITWGLISVNVTIYLLISLPLSMQAPDLNDPLLQDYLSLLAPALSRGVPLRDLLESISAYDLFVFAHGYKPGAPQLTDLFSSMFLHGGFWHLAGNMLFLWIFGDNVEHQLGRLGYLLTYLATGVVATLSFAALAGASPSPLVGASGAISGVLGLYFLLFRRNKVKVLVVLFPIFFDAILLPARWVLGFYVLVDNLLPLLFGAQSNVAYGAHLGGFVAGLAVAWLGERLTWRWPWQEPGLRVGAGRSAAPPGTAAETAAGLVRLREALARGDNGAVVAQLAELRAGELGQLEPAECVEIARLLDASGYAIAASNMLRRCLVAHGRHRDLAQVYLALGQMRLSHGQPTAAYQHLLSVFDHGPDPETARAARAALANIDVYQPGRRRR